MNGFIKLHRRIQRNLLWDDGEPFCRFKAFVDLLFLAEWKPKKRVIKGCIINAERGQVVASQRFLGERWKWSKNKVMRFLNMLAADQIVDHQTDHGVTVITICNYERYQDEKSADGPLDGPLDGPVTDHRRTTDGPPTDQETDQERTKLPSSASIGYELERTTNGPPTSESKNRGKVLSRTELEEDMKKNEEERESPSLESRLEKFLNALDVRYYAGCLSGETMRLVHDRAPLFLNDDSLDDLCRRAPAWLKKRNKAAADRGAIFGAVTPTRAVEEIDHILATDPGSNGSGRVRIKDMKTLDEMCR